MLGCFVGAEEAPRAVSKLNVRLSRRALDKYSGSTDVGWALLPVLCALSRPRVANLRLNQQPVKAFLLILAARRLSVYAALGLGQTHERTYAARRSGCS